MWWNLGKTVVDLREEMAVEVEFEEDEEGKGKWGCGGVSWQEMGPVAGLGPATRAAPEVSMVPVVVISMEY